MGFQNRRDGDRDRKRRDRGPRGTEVEVWDNNIEAAMQRLKKIMLREGVGNDMRRGEAFVKPSEKRRRAANAARKRHLKEKAKREEDPFARKKPAARKTNSRAAKPPAGNAPAARESAAAGR